MKDFACFRYRRPAFCGSPGRVVLMSAGEKLDILVLPPFCGGRWNDARGDCAHRRAPPLRCHPPWPSKKLSQTVGIPLTPPVPFSEVSRWEDRSSSRRFPICCLPPKRFFRPPPFFSLYRADADGFFSAVPALSRLMYESVGRLSLSMGISGSPPGGNGGLRFLPLTDVVKVGFSVLFPPAALTKARRSSLCSFRKKTFDCEAQMVPRTPLPPQQVKVSNFPHRKRRPTQTLTG